MMKNVIMEENKEEKPNGSYHIECGNCGELTHQRLICCEHCGNLLKALNQNK